MNSQKNQSSINQLNPSKEPLLGLPSVESATQTENNGAITLDELGPLVVNEDGTLSRVSNWKQMSDIEKATFQRVLLARNKKRLNELKKKEENEAKDE